MNPHENLWKINPHSSLICYALISQSFYTTDSHFAWLMSFGDITRKTHRQIDGTNSIASTTDAGGNKDNMCKFGRT